MTPKKLDIGTLMYPAYWPDLDKTAIVKVIYKEVERQLYQFSESEPGLKSDIQWIQIEMGNKLQSTKYEQDKV